MDIVIQGHMNGIELCNVVTGKFPQCMVIYMTAYSDKDTFAQVKQTKHVGILNKPFESYQLQQILEKVN